MTKQLILYLNLSLLLFLGACIGNDVEPTPDVSEEVSCELTLEEDVWIYFSMKEEKVIGKSTFGDEAEDKEWSERSDWDIAFCNGFIRTNGGTSGKGKGAILKSAYDYDVLIEAPIEGLYEDRVIGGANN